MLHKNITMIIAIIIGLGLSLSVLGLIGGCKQGGTAENAGKKIDKAGFEAKQAAGDGGPTQRAGQKIDNAASKVKNAVTPN